MIKKVPSIWYCYIFLSVTVLLVLNSLNPNLTLTDAFNLFFALCCLLSCVE